MKMTLDQWAAREFHQNSLPPKTTLWRWVREGKIPAARMGRRYYVPSDFTLGTGNALADRILTSQNR